MEFKDSDNMIHVDLGSPRGDDIAFEGEFNFKILVVGEPSVGKTSLVRRYTNNKFSAEYKSTIGVDFSAKTINIGPGTDVTLQLWDLAGQERIGDQLAMYFREARAVIIVYDITNEPSKDAVTEWKRHIDANCTVCDNPYRPPTAILCNKIDLQEPNEDEALALKTLAENTGCVLASFVSVKDDISVDEVFARLAAAALNQEKLIEEMKKTTLSDALDNDNGIIQITDDNDDYIVEESKRCC